MKLVSDYFGSMVFDDKVMKSMLSEEDYNTLKRTVKDGRSLNLSVANAVATAMKDWAISLGATHFTHWFTPMTGLSAEKHDSFLELRDNKISLEISGKHFVKVTRMHLVFQVVVCVLRLKLEVIQHGIVLLKPL